MSAIARLRLRRSAARLAWLLAPLALGCASPPPIAELTFVAFEPGVVQPTILQGNVEGEWCFTENLIAVSLRPPWRARFADRGRAIAAAIESVPGANVLTDIRVQIRVEQYLLFQRKCARVTGNAGRLQ
ncbi:MAG: hypothetical protein JSU66_02620 [Deltaproteobacteria bacterium]|nr:MAG: hypothetical protein JSU66_02620 [Deltaproteobacteria bacterium]